MQMPCNGSQIALVFGTPPARVVHVSNLGIIRMPSVGANVMQHALCDGHCMHSHK